MFAGPTSDIVQLKYTWVLDTSINEIKRGGTYGIFKVDGTDPIIELKNDAADNDELRIYPMVEYKMSAGETNEIAKDKLSLSEKETGNINVPITPQVAAKVQTTMMPADGAQIEPAQSTISTPVHNLPGFEIMLAISSFLVVIYFLLRQRK